MAGVEQTAKHSIEILNDALDLKTNLTQTIRGNTGNRANNNLRLLEKLSTHGQNHCALVFLTKMVTLCIFMRQLDKT
jgi:hypothetical protein